MVNVQLGANLVISDLSLALPYLTLDEVTSITLNNLPAAPFVTLQFSFAQCAFMALVL